MDQGQGQERTQQLSDDPDRAAAQLRSEIEDARTDLGDTVEALAAKTDVKTRAREKAEELKAKVSGAMPSGNGAGSGGDVASSAGSGLTQARTWARRNPVPTAAIGAAVGGFLIGRLTNRGS